MFSALFSLLSARREPILPTALRSLLCSFALSSFFFAFHAHSIRLTCPVLHILPRSWPALAASVWLYIGRVLAHVGPSWPALALVLHCFGPSKPILALSWPILVVLSRFSLILSFLAESSSCLRLSRPAFGFCLSLTAQALYHRTTCTHAASCLCVRVLVLTMLRKQADIVMRRFSLMICKRARLEWV